jgi:hypothetical protein
MIAFVELRENQLFFGRMCVTGVQSWAISQMFDCDKTMKKLEIDEKRDTSASYISVLPGVTLRLGNAAWSPPLCSFEREMGVDAGTKHISFALAMPHLTARLFGRLPRSSFLCSCFVGGTAVPECGDKVVAQKQKGQRKGGQGCRHCRTDHPLACARAVHGTFPNNTSSIPSSNANESS